METKMTFDEAVRQCNGIPLDEFAALLHKRVDELYDKHEAEMAKVAQTAEDVKSTAPKRKPARPQQIQHHA